MFLFVDELNSKLHLSLVRNFLINFLDFSVNKNYVQIIFTTHHSWTLSNNLLRRDEVSLGGFYDGLTLEDALSGMQSFRNENLVKLLFKLGYIENYASGLSRIYSEYSNEELKPSIESSMVMLKLTLPNINYLAFKKSDDTINEQLKSVIDIIATHPGIKRKDIAIILNKSVATISRYVKELVNQGLVIKEGSNKTGGYVIISQKNQEQ